MAEETLYLGESHLLPLWPYNKYGLWHLRAPLGYLRAPLGYLRAPLGYLRAPLWCLRALIKHSQSALIEFEPLNDEIFQKFFQIMNPILIF